MEAWLTEGQAWIFFSQGDPDQRHGLDAGRIARAGGGDIEVIRAALLHDVGKRHARLGVVGRSLASVCIRLNVPMPRRWQLYRDHGETAARELEGLGFRGLIVDFARHHHGSRPPAIPAATWSLLQLADQPPKTGRVAGSE